MNSHRAALIAQRSPRILERLPIPNGAVTADRARAALSAFFSWAIREGVAEMNPVVGTNKAAGNVSRDRVLTDEEIQGIWRALPQDDYGDIVRLLFLTRQRPNEIAGLEVNEINWAGRAIELPGARTKNKRAHSIPLSDPALDILRARPRKLGRALVFGEGRGGFQGWSKAKTALNTRAGLTAPWQLRDIRRTVVTRLGDIGVHPHVAEAIVNHVSGSKVGVAGVYNKAMYTPEKIGALNAWADHLIALVTSPHYPSLSRARL